MASLPPFRTLQFNQIPGAPAWFAPFLDGLNRYLGAVYDMANKGTSLGDNVPAQYKTLTVTVSAEGTFAAQSFKSELKVAPKACLLAQAELTAGTRGTSAISLNQWTNDGGMVKLDSIVGLQPSCTYRLTFLVF